MKIGLISGFDGGLRYASPVGHQLYARRHGLQYHLELASFVGSPGYWHKVAALEHHLENYDWVVWIDDDAFITDTESRFLRDTLEAADRDGHAIVVAPSTDTELNGAWAAYNTGVVALRRSLETRTLLGMMRSADMRAVEEWWDSSRLGMFTNGDQDALVWALEPSGCAEAVRLADPLRWNSRPWYYRNRLSDCPVCHFPGHPDKTLAIHQLGRRLGVDETLTEGTSFAPPLLSSVDAQVPRISTAGLIARAALRSSTSLAQRTARKYHWVRETGRWS